MLTVVDLGCADHSNGTVQTSPERLVERFRPDAYVGFDPYPGAPTLRPAGFTGGFTVTEAAAWTKTGTLPLLLDGTSTRLADTGVQVRTINLLAVLRRLLDESEVVVRMDVEGAELPLLEAIHRQHLDTRLQLVLVEWHNHLAWWTAEHARRRVRIETLFRCPLEEWW